MSSRRDKTGFRVVRSISDAEIDQISASVTPVQPEKQVVPRLKNHYCWDVERNQVGLKLYDFDLCWTRPHDQENQLGSVRGARLQEITSLDFDQVNFETLISIPFPRFGLPGRDSIENPQPRTVPGLRTSTRNYANLRITRLIPNLDNDSFDLELLQFCHAAIESVVSRIEST